MNEIIINNQTQATENIQENNNQIEDTNFYTQLNPGMVNQSLIE